MRVHIAHRVGELGELGLGGAGDARIGVAGGGDGEGGGEVEILFAVGVPYVDALGAFPNDGPRAVLREVGDVAAFVVAQEFEVGVHFLNAEGAETQRIAEGNRVENFCVPPRSLRALR